MPAPLAENLGSEIAPETIASALEKSFAHVAFFLTSTFHASKTFRNCDASHRGEGRIETMAVKKAAKKAAKKATKKAAKKKK